MVLICLIGIDGSGKTTVAKQLVKTLTDKGFNVKYVWSRFEPWIAKPFIFLAKHILLKNRNIYDNYEEYSKIRGYLFKNAVLSILYLAVVIPDMFIQNIIKIGVPILLGKSIVADRYVFDTVVDIAWDKKYNVEHAVKLLKSLLFLLPKPKIVFLLDIDEEIALKRKNDIPSLEYVKGRRALYLAISKEIGAVKPLDGSKDLLTLESEILNELEKQGLL